jgi:hypothetical protein
MEVELNELFPTTPARRGQSRLATRISWCVKVGIGTAAAGADRVGMGEFCSAEFGEANGVCRCGGVDVCEGEMCELWLFGGGVGCRLMKIRSVAGEETCQSETCISTDFVVGKHYSEKRYASNPNLDIIGFVCGVAARCQEGLERRPETLSNFRPMPKRPSKVSSASMKK